MKEINIDENFSKLRDGDQEAFSVIYNTIKQPVFTVIYCIVFSREIAEDLTHDVFIKLFVSPPDPSVKKTRAWIFQIARNLAIDALRKKQCDELNEDVPESKDAIEQVLQRMDIDSAMARLPCVEREIFTLHINAELPFNEISRIVNLSLPSTYRTYRKALNTLRKEINGGAL